MAAKAKEKPVKPKVYVRDTLADMRKEPPKPVGSDGVNFDFGEYRIEVTAVPGGIQVVTTGRLTVRVAILPSVSNEVFIRAEEVR